MSWRGVLRLAYILGDVVGLSGQDAGKIAGIGPVAFRKRLSRARAKVHGFREQKCGLVNPNAPCRCARRVEHAVRIGRVDPTNLLFAAHPVLPPEEETRTAVGEMERLHAAADIFRGHPRYAAPGAAAEAIRVLLAAPLRVLGGSS
jgi:hypothetical protein